MLMSDNAGPPAAKKIRLDINCNGRVGWLVAREVFLLASSRVCTFMRMRITYVRSKPSAKQASISDRAVSEVRKGLS